VADFSSLQLAGFEKLSPFVGYLFWRSTNALAFERLCRPGGSMPQALIK
jgi:hypothetical protein